MRINNILLFTLVFCSLLTSSWSASAHSWVTLKIPGAKCGDGRDYEILFDKKSDRKFVFEFTPGGACWSASTCYGPNLRTWIYPIPELPSFSMLTSDEPKHFSPFANHSLIHFPYCTGDVYAGHHVANYIGDIKTYHYGYQNIQLALKFLTENNYVSWNQLEEVTLWGASAGAIGAFIHTASFDPYLQPQTRRVVIADSPGLHFGNQFWDKFPQKMFNDFQDSFGKIHLKIEKNNGLVTEGLPAVFNYLSHWEISVLIGSRDIIMSELFGEISMKEHHQLVMGPHGLPAIAKNFSNVNTWVKDTKMHTFLVLEKSANMKNEQHLSAFDFAVRTMNEAYPDSK